MPDNDKPRTGKALYPPLRRLLHYVVEDAQIGNSKVKVWAWRCEVCEADFHMDNTPNCCPHCGVIFNGEAKFGEHRNA